MTTLLGSFYMCNQSVADVEGPWSERGFDSGLIQRCRENWSVPVKDLTNYALATFIRQQIALSIVIPEAKRRVEARYIDDTEMYDGELEYAINTASKA